MTRFQGRRILITGASQGIGRACADLFAAEGAEVIGTYSRNAEAAAQAEAAIKARGHRCSLVKADLGDAPALEAMWAQVRAQGPVHGLILNAAFQQKALFDDTDLPLLLKTLSVNVGGNFLLAKRFVEAARAHRHGGAIVVHSSNQGDHVNPTGFAYGISKAALNHLVHHLARATIKDGIRVNGVQLGWFNTEGERRFYSDQQIREQGAAGVPIGRVGEPLEAAQVAAFLASDESSYMTGGLIRCDGGFALDPDLST